ncbi:hypothetical protein WL84_09145 [Burkholderia cenocepacia]|uniref:hypothetical protein n=1 Tax=Burkholderia cenocepacia TaxID=95486 RepID=UPI00075DAC21|nr:hypothetical protein [Burkholderia cenocepacia]KWF29492.1 hypothetical protein WL84_09145 [Burkholderia cenocepacia]
MELEYLSNPDDQPLLSCQPGHALRRQMTTFLIAAAFDPGQPAIVRLRVCLACVMRVILFSIQKANQQ